MATYDAKENNSIEHKETVVFEKKFSGEKDNCNHIWNLSCYDQCILTERSILKLNDKSDVYRTVYAMPLSSFLNGWTKADHDIISTIEFEFEITYKSKQLAWHRDK